MSIHVAILLRPYLTAVLAGTKTIESRLTKTARPPYGAVQPGERLFFKESGGPFRATALVRDVAEFADLTPSRVDRLRQRYEAAVGGDDAYWHGKRSSAYAVFVGVGQVEPLAVGPRYAVQSMRAWYVLPDEASPLREWHLTAGAIRNRYALLPGASARLRSETLALVLPDGREIETSFGRGSMLRWRGWSGVYESARVRPGDRLRFVALGHARFAVVFPDSEDRSAGDSIRPDG